MSPRPVRSPEQPRALPRDCAWCFRATQVNGEWQRADRATLLARKAMATHGMCATCMATTARQWGVPLALLRTRADA